MKRGSTLRVILRVLTPFLQNAGTLFTVDHLNKLNLDTRDAMGSSFNAARIVV